MKKVFLLFIVLLCAALSFAQKATKPAGSGTEIDPYLIATIENLFWMSKTTNDSLTNKFFTQTADINAAETKTWNGGNGFKPIGTGAVSNINYNGNGWYIDSLYINRPTETFVGLFGVVITATIQNVILTNCNITGNTDVGTLAGRVNSNSTITKCASYGSVKGYDNVGGLIGTGSKSTISFSFSHADVIGTHSYIGGFIGYVNGSIVTKCYARGSVKGAPADGWHTGGFVGYGSGFTFTQCYASGKVSGYISVGGLIGSIDSTLSISSSISSSYWDTVSTGCISGIGSGSTLRTPTLTGLSTIAMRNYTSFIGWTFDNGSGDWSMNTDTEYPGYPRLRSFEPVIVSSGPVTTATTATTVTEMLDYCNKTITKYGICWSINKNPTINDSKTVETVIPTAGSIYYKAITGLLPNTLYHYRAYAISDRGRLYYFNDIAFATAEQAPSISYPTQYLHLAKGVNAGAIKPNNAGGAPQQMIVTHYAGNGNAGVSNSTRLNSEFKGLAGLAFGLNSTLYVADNVNTTAGSIRKIPVSANVSTLYSLGVSAIGVATFGSNVYHSSNDANKVYRNGILFYSNGLKTSCGLATDVSGNIYIADKGNNRIVKISSTGTFIEEITGLSFPEAVAVGNDGTVYIANTNAHTIVKKTPTGSLELLAGSGRPAAAVDGVGSVVNIQSPQGICVDGDGNVYVGNSYDGRIRKITPSGIVTTIAGWVKGTSKIGIGTAAVLNSPVGLALDSINNLYVAEFAGNFISKLTCFSISPSLPNGLSFNTNTGEITGTPTAASAMTAYTVTCANTAGTSTTTLSFATEDPKLSVSTTNNALAFDGKKDYVQINTTSAPSFSNNAPFTIETWFNAASTGALISKYKGGSYSPFGIFVENVDGAAKIFLYLQVGSGGLGHQFSKAFSFNTWNHLAIVYTGSSSSNKVYFYLNGIKEDSLSISSSSTVNLSSDIPLLLGAANEKDGSIIHKYTGSIDQVRIWKTARPKDSIIANMNKTLLIGNNLVANYNFNQATANGINKDSINLKDLSSNSYNGTLTNFTLSGNISNWTTGAPLDYNTEPTAIILNKEASTAYAEVSSNIEWTASSNKDWLQVALSGSSLGSASSTVSFTSQSATSSYSSNLQFTATTNTTVTSREATITIIASGVSIKTITISQAAGNATLWIKDSILNFSRLENVVDTIIIKSNTTPRITNVSQWITAWIKDTFLIVSVPANTASIARKDSFQLSVEGIGKKIIVSQAAGAVVLKPNTTKLAYNAKYDLIQSFFVDANANISISTSASWLQIGFTGVPTDNTIEDRTTDFRTKTIYVKADTNTVSTVRMDSIVIVSGGLRKVISIEQDAAIVAQKVRDTSIMIGQAVPKYLYKDLFKYAGKRTLNYEIVSTNMDVVSYAPIYGGFKLVSGLVGTASITVRAKSAVDSAKLTFTIRVESGAVCMKVDSAIVHPVCSGDSTGQIIITPRTGTAPYYYSWSNYMSNDTVKKLAAGKYIVTITDALGCTIVTSFTVKQGSKIVLDVQTTAPNCKASDGAIQVSARGGHGEYSYIWKGGKTTAAITNIPSESYTVTVSDTEGCSAVQEIVLNDKDAVQINLTSVIESPCKINKGAIYTNIIGAYDAIQWSKELSNVSTILTDSTDKQITSLFPGKYAMTVTSGNCVAVKKIEVPYTKMTQPQLSLVTIDKSFKYPLVVWLRDADSTAVESYTIFRDGKAITTLPYRSYSVFQDEDPSVKLISQAYSYQISAKNACGFSTPKSDGFKTIFIQLHNSGLNPMWLDLSWDDYQGDVSEKTYTIYRLTNNDTTLIDAINGKYRFTDTEIKSSGSVQYFISLKLDASIVVSQLKTDTGPFSQSFSNMSEAKLVSAPEIATKNIANGLSLQPNPTNDALTITVSNATIAGDVLIVSADGSIRRIAITNVGETSVNVSVLGLAAGVYSVQVPIADGIRTERLVIIK